MVIRNCIWVWCRGAQLFCATPSDREKTWGMPPITCQAPWTNALSKNTSMPPSVSDQCMRVRKTNPETDVSATKKSSSCWTKYTKSQPGKKCGYSLTRTIVSYTSCTECGTTHCDVIKVIRAWSRGQVLSGQKPRWYRSRWRRTRWCRARWYRGGYRARWHRARWCKVIGQHHQT